jgi:hypothetical protein
LQFDGPGQEKSDLFFADQDLFITSDYFKQVLDNSQECSTSTTCSLIGCGGGELVFEFAIKYPDYVSALGYMDVYPKDYEFQSLQDKTNATNKEIQSIKTDQMNARVGFAAIYTALAIPWGLMVLFYGGPYEPAAFRSEYQATYFTDKIWPVQGYAIKAMINEEDVAHPKVGIELVGLRGRISLTTSNIVYSCFAFIVSVAVVD